LLLATSVAVPVYRSAGGCGGARSPPPSEPTGRSLGPALRAALALIPLACGHGSRKATGWTRSGACCGRSA